MRLLAIDTALNACSVAVLDTEAGGPIAHEQLPMARGHAEALMPMIQRVMSAADTTFPDLDRIAVTTGPGSFTGLRVGLSAARGIALASGKPVFGLTTLAVFAAPYVAQAKPRPVISVVDARHGQFYMQVVAGNGNTLIPPRVALTEEVLRAGRFGPPCLVGNAAAAIAAIWPADFGEPETVADLPAPDIAWVGWLGAATQTASRAPARPLYLKPPDAKPQTANRLPLK